MKRVISTILAVLFLFTAPHCVLAEDETVLTLEIPKGDISYTGDAVKDAFALAVGFSLSEDCVGLSGYGLTVRWDPNVLALNTDYREDMTDNEMARCKGCYFKDLYGDDLVMAPTAMSAINYRNVFKGEVTVVSIGLEDIPYRDAVLFVLDLIPLCDNASVEITVEVKEIVGLMSSEGMIEHYRDTTTMTLQIGEEALRGDADTDGSLTIADALLIKRHACKQNILTGSALFAADYNKDGKVDARDYLFVCKELQNQ